MASGIPDQRTNNFDAIRLILALLVILTHSFWLIQVDFHNEPLHVLARNQMSLGDVAVDEFFVISGFLITQSWFRSKSAWAYLKKRVYRIVPGFVLAAAVCAWIVIPLASSQGRAMFTPRYLVEFARATLKLQLNEYVPTFLHNPVPNYVNASLWSIPYEFWCYLSIAALGLLGVLRRRWLILGLFIAALALYLGCALRGTLPAIKLHPVLGKVELWVRLIPYYYSGVVAYLFRDRLRLDGRTALLAAVGLGIGMRVPHGLIVTLPTLGTYLLLYVAYHPAIPLQHAARYGDFSYGTYLYGYPIQQLLVQALGPGLNPYVLFLLAVPPTLAAAAFSWYAVERPFLRAVRKSGGPQEK